MTISLNTKSLSDHRSSEEVFRARIRELAIKVYAYIDADDIRINDDDYDGTPYNSYDNKKVQSALVLGVVRIDLIKVGNNMDQFLVKVHHLRTNAPGYSHVRSPLLIEFVSKTYSDASLLLAGLNTAYTRYASKLASLSNVVENEA
jgi:hypothetical protein